MLPLLKSIGLVTLGFKTGKFAEISVYSNGIVVTGGLVRGRKCFASSSSLMNLTFRFAFFLPVASHLDSADL